MGGCISKSRKVYTSSQLDKQVLDLLEEMQKSVSGCIIRLHKLVLKCRKAVELSLIQNSIMTAVLIFGKETCIRNEIKALQKVLDNLDLLTEFKSKYNYVKQEIRKAESKIEKNLSKPIFSDDVDVIMKNDDKDIEVVKRQLEFEHFDQKSAKTHIEKKLQNMESSLTTKRFRRRYIKTIN